MGYTVTLTQNKYYTKSGSENFTLTEKWLIYTPNEEVLDAKSDMYEMMNLETGEIIKITKEKTKLFGIFTI